MMKKWHSLETYKICQTLLNETREWHEEGKMQIHVFKRDKTLPHVLNVDMILYGPGESSKAISEGKFSVLPGNNSSFLVHPSSRDAWMVTEKTDVIPNIIGHYQYYVQRIETTESARNIIYHINDSHDTIHCNKMFHPERVAYQSHFVREYATLYCLKYEVIQYLLPVLVEDVVNIIVSLLKVDL